MRQPERRGLFARLLGTPAKPDSGLEMELRHLQDAGDDARRNHQPELALKAYQNGLELARANSMQAAQEMFLGMLGAFYTEQRQYALAEESFDEALTLATQSGQAMRQARATLNQGAYYLKRGDFQKAQSLLEQALDLARKSNDLVTTSLALGNLADVYLKQNNPAYAMRLLKEAAPQIMQQPMQAAYLLGRMGQAHLALNEIERGRKTLLQAIALSEQNKQPELELMWVSLLAGQAFKEGQYAEAIRLYQRADELSQNAINIPEEFGALRNMSNHAAALQRLSRNDEALELTNHVLERARAERDTSIEGMALMTLGHIQQTRGQMDEAVKAFEAAATLYKDIMHSDADRTAALLALGALYQDRGDIEKALSIFNDALDNSGESDRVGRANTLRRIGAVFQKQGNIQAALEKWTEALSIYELTNEYAQAARLLCEIAGLRRAVAGINAALQDYERATMLLNHVRDAGTRGMVLSNVANVYTDRGEVETAKAFYDEALELARQTNNRRAESLRLGNYAWFYIMTGRPRDALSLLENALNISRELNDPLMIAVQTNNLAQSYHELKEFSRAEDLYKKAIADTGTVEPRWKAMFQSNLARTYLAQGRSDEAVALLESALPISRDAGDTESVVRALTRLAEGYLRQGKIKQADDASKESETLARKWGYRKGHADAMVVRSGVMQAQADVQSSRNYLQEARRLYQILHDPLAGDLAKLLGEA